VPDFAETSWCDIDQDGVYGNDRDTDIYVHNCHPYPITVMLDDGVAGSIPLNVPAHSTISVIATLGRDLSDKIGAHLFSDETFWGVAAIDSTSGSSADSSSQSNDWGYSLIPVDRLSSRVVLGWAPGNSLVPPNRDPRHNSGNLAFVSAFTDTVVFVDLFVEAVEGNRFAVAEAFDINGDGDADDFDLFGNNEFDEPRSDDGIRLHAGQVLRVADPNDNDLTGAVIYTSDLSQKIAVAWGQDPCRAEPRQPYLDLGYTVLAAPIPSLAKQADLSLVADLTGKVSPGEVITYHIAMRNNGLGPMFSGVLTDTLPYTHTDFVVDSLALTEPPDLENEDYFNGETGSWGHIPTATAEGVDPATWALRLDWSFIGAGETVSGTLRVKLDDDIPSETQEVCNQIVFCSHETGCVFSKVCTPIGRPHLQMDKLSEPDSVRPGQLLTYTVVTTNTGDGIATGALVVDHLPSFVTYIPGTLRLTLPAVVGKVTTMTVPVTTSFNGSYADDFDLTITQTTGYTGNDGVFAWLTDWIEVDDPVGPGPMAGDVLVGSLLGADLSPPGYLELTDEDDIVSGVTRTVDLVGFISPTLRFFVSGINNPSAAFQVTANGTPLLSERYSGPYVRRVVDLSAYAGSTVVLAFFVEPDVEQGQSYRLDNVRVVESSPLRTAIETRVDTVGVLTYTTVTNADPVAYDPVANVLTVTDQIRIPPTAFVGFSFQVEVSSPLTDGLHLLNRATITSTNVLTNPQDSTTTPVVSTHALTVTKTGDPSIVYLGERITYTLFWEVGGDEPAPGVIVTDTLPWPYVSFVGCEGGLSCDYIAPDTVVWKLGDLLPAASGVRYASGWLTLTARTERYPPNEVFTNTVVLDDATDTPPAEDDEPTNVLDVGFVLRKRRITPSPVTVGDPIQFSIVITNLGALPITYLPLSDYFDPVYMQYASAEPIPDRVSMDALIWNDLVAGIEPDAVLPTAGVIEVLVAFEAISSTEHLRPPVTVNVAESVGARTIAGSLPRVSDQDDVGILASSTAIELLYLRAAPKSSGVLLEWATLLELDTVGFRLYRSENAKLVDGVPITFVPAKGWGGFGALYQYYDADLSSGLYYYWLKEVDSIGTETTYGSVSAWSGWNDDELPNRFYLPVITK
jgi:uncharacterized repeat protein (TIGR01451 family)